MATREEVREYWKTGENYKRYIKEELNSFRKQAWKDVITSHFNGKKSLEILDVGTGPGFFSCILSEEGHKLTGIDSSDGMLQHARENAEYLGVNPTFLKMDIEEMDFEDAQFDAVIMRNVSWTLLHPEKSYADFHRLLKKGGFLLIYDANWHHHFADAEKMELVKRLEAEQIEKYGRREVISDDDAGFLLSLPSTHVMRPDWDVPILEQLGFDVTTKLDLGRIVYEQWEKELYSPCPLFEICGQKR